jgi:hypothetical protein
VELKMFTMQAERLPDGTLLLKDMTSGIEVYRGPADETAVREALWAYLRPGEPIGTLRITRPVSIH